MLTRLLLALFLFFILAWPASGQGPIYLPIIEASMIKPLKSTIAITLPQQDQNYVLNPSAEIAGNFATVAGGAANRGNIFTKYGIFSYEITPVVDGDGIEFSTLALDNENYYVTFRVNWNDGQTVPITLRITIGSTEREARFLEKIDRTWDLYGAIFSAAEANGQTSLSITQLGAGVPVPATIYLDGIQASRLIEGRYYTTYIDGTQLNCVWLGAPHASASTRSGDSRAGGVVTNFWEGFNFFPEKALGLGTAIEELNIDSYAFLPGGELNSSKIPPREFTIIGYFLADTVEELHEHAQRLELELGLNTYPGRQPVRLRYSGARVLKEISANYTGGLEGDLPIFYNDDWSQEDEAWVRNYKFKMRASVSFVALDPFWYEVGESATLLETSDSATFDPVAARLKSTGQWDNLGAPAVGAAFDDVLAIAEDDTYVYIGGDFDDFGGANGDNIVRYNKQTGVISSLGTGLDGQAEVIVVSPSGLVYVAGNFTDAGGVSVSNLAVWNPVTETWADVGGGTDGQILAMAFGPDGILYIGGTGITDAGGVAVANIASWNGTVFDNLGTGLNGACNAIVVSLSNVVYVAGNFTTAGGGAAIRVAAWDVANSDWSALGDGLDANVRTLALSPNGALLYAGGDFTSFIAFWNGVIWQVLGGGADDVVASMSTGPDGILYVVGGFSVIGDLTLNSTYVRWNGYTWANGDGIIPGVGNVIFASKNTDPIIKSNYDLWRGSTAGGTGTFAGIETVENEGTISAFPKIVFNRSGGTTANLVTLRNERTGRQLLFNYSLLDGETLTIYLDPRNRTITSSFFGTRMDARLTNDDFSVWQLLPGDNDITSFVNESGSPTITAYVLYRTPYRGWN